MGYVTGTNPGNPPEEINGIIKPPCPHLQDIWQTTSGASGVMFSRFDPQVEPGEQWLHSIDVMQTLWEPEERRIRLHGMPVPALWTYAYKTSMRKWFRGKKRGGKGYDAELLFWEQLPETPVSDYAFEEYEQQHDLAVVFGTLVEVDDVLPLILDALEAHGEARGGITEEQRAIYTRGIEGWRPIDIAKKLGKDPSSITRTMKRVQIKVQRYLNEIGR